MLLTVPYNPDSQTRQVVDYRAEVIMQYSEFNPENMGIEPATFTKDEVLDRFSTSEIPNAVSFVAERMTIRPSSERKAEDGTRLVILGKNRLQYKIFKLVDKAEKPTVTEDTSML